MKRLLFPLCALCFLCVLCVRRTAGEEAGAAPAGDPKASALRDTPPERAPEVRVTPEMIRYSNTRYALYFAGTLVSTLALLFLLRSGISARLRDLAGQPGRNGLARAYVYYPLLTLAYGAITFPLAFYASFLLPRQYGLSNQSLGGWVVDGLKGFAISALLGPPVVALLFWTIRRSPQRWWVTFWLASIPLITLATVASPLIVDPLFNRFEPLKNETLRERILALAQRAGIERGRVYEMDASSRTKAVNAYVTGLGGSARIVLWDTLLQKLDDDEVLFVMAHEMGHYVEGHVAIGLSAAIAGSLLVLFLTDRITRRLLERGGERCRISGLDDLAALPAMLLVLLLLNFVGDPVSSFVSRTIEERADTFGLRLTHNGRAAASSFIKLSELNLSNPDPPKFIEIWMFSHPPLRSRIRKALAWDENERMKK